jgi:aminoglycoside phosphotransferase (APT) family kinase protein
MDGQGLGNGPISDVNALHGGTQNVMLRFSRSGRSFVLRRGPRQPRAGGERSIQREMRLLAALANSEVPHARLIRACPDGSVLGSSFYLMELVEGFNATVELPALHAGDRAVRHQMGMSLVDALVRLGDVDYRACGLGSFGRPDGFLERQVPRWMSELDRYRRQDEYRRSGPLEIGGLAEWLDQRTPRTWTPGIMHGDYHLANVLFSRDGAGIAAIVDWELATIGDPLLDLGLLLATWPGPGGAADLWHSPLAAAGGLPSAAEMASRYASASVRDLSALRWYTVLASFKLGILLEGTYVRSLTGQAPRGTGDQLRSLARMVVGQAERLIAAA